MPVLYDGNPAWPTPDLLWKMADDTGANLFGASPTYQSILEKAGIVPKDRFKLEKLETIVLAGSPVTAECQNWFYENVKADIWAHSGSGGTDVCSGLVGGVVNLPIYAGEIQARQLGVAAYAFDDQGKRAGRPGGRAGADRAHAIDAGGLLGRQERQRYRESYFDQYPGVWRHGDFFRVNARGGCFVLGRSDATLNRHGVRIGTAEVYRSLLGVPEVEDSLIVNLDLPGGRFFMPLFVKLKGDVAARRRTSNRASACTDPERVFAAARAGPDLPGEGDPIHAHRQEDGSAGAPHPHGRAASKRPRIARRWPTSNPWISSSHYARTQSDYTGS